MNTTSLKWRKSTFSGPNSDCVELAAHPDGHLLMRNSNAPDAGTLTLARTDLAALLDGCRAGALDDLT